MYQARAVAYCDEVKASPSCLQLCLTRFSSSPYLEVRFWCLQTLHEVCACLVAVCSCRAAHQALQVKLEGQEIPVVYALLDTGNACQFSAQTLTKCRTLVQVLQKNSKSFEAQQLSLVRIYQCAGDAISEGHWTGWRASCVCPEQCSVVADQTDDMVLGARSGAEYPAALLEEQDSAECGLRSAGQPLQCIISCTLKRIWTTHLQG